MRLTDRNTGVLFVLAGLLVVALPLGTVATIAGSLVLVLGVLFVGLS